MKLNFVISTDADGDASTNDEATDVGQVARLSRPHSKISYEHIDQQQTNQKHKRRFTKSFVTPIHPKVGEMHAKKGVDTARHTHDWRASRTQETAEATTKDTAIEHKRGAHVTAGALNRNAKRQSQTVHSSQHA